MDPHRHILQSKLYDVSLLYMAVRVASSKNRGFPTKAHAISVSILRQRTYDINSYLLLISLESLSANVLLVGCRQKEGVVKLLIYTLGAVPCQALPVCALFTLRLLPLVFSFFFGSRRVCGLFNQRRTHFLW